jgi:radical SAM protein with 4Fe4S-binding SPASM domain
MQRRPEVLGFETVRKIIDEVAEKKISNWICLHVMGEPTLHPNFFEIVGYLNQKGLDVSLITNGTYPAEKFAARLEGLELAALQISVNSQDSFEFEGRDSRIPMTYENYLHNISNFIRIYSGFNKATPVALSYLLTVGKRMPKDLRFVNSSEDARRILGFWMDFWEKLETDSRAGGQKAEPHPRFKAKSESLGRLPVLSRKDIGRAVHLTGQELVCRIAPRLFVYFKPCGDWHHQLADETTFLKKNVRGTCKVLEREFAVLANGDCTFCCGDYEGKIKLGNIHRDSVETIMAGEKVKRIREANRRLILSEEICQICKGQLYDRKTGKPVYRERFGPAGLFKEVYSYYRRFGLKSVAQKVVSKIFTS